MFSLRDEPDPAKPPCPNWCHSHWAIPGGWHVQHLGVDLIYTGGVAHLERLDTPSTEGPTSIVIEPINGEPITLPAIDAGSLVYALSALWADAIK